MVVSSVLDITKIRFGRIIVELIVSIWFKLNLG